MNLISKIFKPKKDVRSIFWSTDIYSNDGLRLFYYSKEAIHSYCIAEGIQQRRAVSLQIAEILQSILLYNFTIEEMSFITSLLSNNTKIINKTKKPNIGILNHLKSLNPDGFKLLEISNQIDLSTLKILYRTAVKKHHPDIGGSLQKMQLVNEAYSVFHDALSNYYPLSGLNNNNSYVASTPENWEEFLFSVHLTLACLYGDLFAADKSYEHLILAYNIAIESRSFFIGQFVGNLLGWSSVLDRVCRILGRFNMENELKKAAKITSYFIDRYFNDWSPKYEGDFKPMRIEYPNEITFLSELGSKLVINHPEQAKNAFRLGKIDERRYLETLKKYDTRQQISDKIINQINDFISTTGFITRLAKTNYDIDIINSKVVISPSFNQDRFDFLEDNQKWEYLNAFSNKNTAINFNKYYEIRTQEILLGLINNYDNLDIDKLKKEITFFATNFPDMFGRYLLINEFVNHLKNLSVNDRINKLKLLHELDDPSPISISMTIDISLDTIFSEHNNNYKKRINLDNNYIEFAMMDFEDIKAYRTNGEYSNSYEKAWNRDLSLLDRLRESDIGKRHEEVWLRQKNPSPETIIESLEPYLCELLKIGDQLHKKNTGELQIGYSINRITVAYAKIKSWEKVIYWGELFFNLPNNYRDRSPDSEQLNIQKRIERARTKVEKTKIL